MNNPRSNADAAYAEFMRMPWPEWRDVFHSLIGGGALEPEERKGWERAMKDRGMNPAYVAENFIHEVGCTSKSHFERYMRIITKTPCCALHTFFRATNLVPKEEYKRTCRGCGKKWIIERRTAQDDNGLNRIDILEWSTP